METTARSRLVGRLLGVCGVLASASASPANGQQQAGVQATARVIVSPASENRALVLELARAATRHRPGTPLKAQGSLAVVRLRIATTAKPAAVVDVQYLRN